MSKVRQQTAVERLREFSRADKQEGGRSPPHTRSGEPQIGETHKGIAVQLDKNMEKQSKLTLKQMNTQLLEAIQSSRGILTCK